MSQIEPSPTQEFADRVTHYVFMSTGPSGGAELGGKYWDVSQGMFKVLKEHGYPDEAIFRFSEHGSAKGCGVSTATIANFRKTFHHLAQILKQDDQVFIFIVGHGARCDGEFVHELLDRQLLTGTELKALVDALPAKDLTIVLHPCYSGACIPKLSAPNRVIVTSTNAQEENRVPWAEAFVEALSPTSGKDTDGDGRISIKEAYNVALQSLRRKYGAAYAEHPLLDDDGDGVGHFGTEDVVGGDGKLAAQRSLGNEGRPLQFSATAIDNLAQLNTKLNLD